MFPHTGSPHKSFQLTLDIEGDIEVIDVLEIPMDEEIDENEVMSSFAFEYLSTSSSCPSSPDNPGISESEEEMEGDEMEEEVGNEGNEEEDVEEGEDQEEEEEGQDEAWCAAEISNPPKGPQVPCSFSSFFSLESVISTGRGSSSQSEEDISFEHTRVDAGSLPSDLLKEKVKDLVHFMILKYQFRKLITKAEILNVVIKRCTGQFPVIFQRACKYLEVICGFDVKEVDHYTPSYVLVNSLDLTYDEMVSGEQSVPKKGLLMIILGVICTGGNSVPEEDVWDVLSIMDVCAGQEHFMCGEPRKPLTKDWVQQDYLEYRQVPNSDPPRYEFLWGIRAHAETSKLKVLEFLLKVKATDPISFSCWYQEAFRDEREQAKARNVPMDIATAMFIAQR